MSKKLNNLLSFDNFDNFDNFQQKKTKRTEVGYDVLNENFYDKLIYKIDNDKPLDSTKDEFITRMTKSITSGQVTDLKNDDESYEFKILGREFKLSVDGGNFVSIKTPISKEYSTFEISETEMSNLKGILDDIDYL